MRRGSAFRKSIGISMVIGLVTSVVALEPAAAAVGSITAVTLDGDKGDYVAGGLSLTFTAANAEIVVAEAYPGGVSFTAADPDHRFGGYFQPPSGQELTPGTYEAARSPDATTAGLDVSGDGRGCNQVVGTFTVHEVAFAEDRSVETFAATYEQHCEGAGPALHGEVRFNSTVDFTAAATDPWAIDFGDVGLTTQSSRDVEIRNTGTLTLQLGGAAITGFDSAEFTLGVDTCSGASLPAGSTCTTEVLFAPGDYGTRLATLTVPDSTARGQRQIGLTGDGVRFGTKVRLTVSKTKTKYGKDVDLTAHLDEFASIEAPELEIYASPYGGQKRSIAAGPVDGSGDLVTVFTMRKKTAFSARYAGGGAYAGDISPTVTVSVYAIATGKMTRYDAVSGKYRLYRFTSRCPSAGIGCPTFAAWVTPTHPGASLPGQLQLYRGGAWRTVLRFRMRLNREGKAVTRFIYGDRRIIGLPTRVRIRFDGDADHLAAVSTWSYFKVTS